MTDAVTNQPASIVSSMYKLERLNILNFMRKELNHLNFSLETENILKKNLQNLSRSLLKVSRINLIKAHRPDTFPIHLIC